MDIKLPEISQEQKTILFGLVVAVVIGGGVMIWRAVSPASVPVTMENADATLAQAQPDFPDRSTITVHLTGCVRKPGVYVMRLGDRVVDLVRIAGGAGAGADLDSVNLSAKLTDGQKIEIFPRVEVVAAVLGQTGVSPSGGKSVPAKTAKVNLNRADVTVLDSLPGIGPRTAQAIADYRKNHGPFGDLEELKNIKGLGKSKIEKLSPFITLH